MSSFMKDYNKWKKTGSFNKEKKSLAKTGLTAANYLGQGALKGAESVFVDAPLQIAGGVKKLFGDEKSAKDLFEAANISLTNAAINKLAGKEANPYITNNQNLFNKQLDENSLIKENNIGGKVVQGIGEMLPTIALTGGISGVGKAAKTAKQLGTARAIGSNALLGTKAFAGATNEAYQESGDIGKSMLYGLGNAAVEIGTEQLSGGIPGLKQIKGDTTKNILKNYGKSVIGEGVEEIASDLANPLLQTIYKGKDALKQYGDAEYWKGVAESGLVGSLTGGILDAPNTISSINTNKTLTKASKQKMSGTITEQNISNNIEELKKEQQATTDNKLKQEYATRINGLEQELNQFKLPMASTEGMTLQESASKYNIKPETQSNVQQLMENRGIESRWDATKFSDNSVNALWSKDANGNRNVIFNPNASLDTIVEEVALHELTHDILSSENTTLNAQEVLDYVSQLDGYNEARQSLENTYSTMYDSNSAEFNSLIDEEVVADVLGRKLGNQEFINQLVNSKPSIAKSIYNWVVNKLNSIVNKGKVRSEKLYWQNIKNNFENAYRQEYKNNEMASTKYKVSDINTDNQGRTLSKQQQEFFKDSKARDNNGNLLEMYHTTPQEFTIFEKSKLGENTGYDNTEFGYFVTPNKLFSERFGDIDNTGQKSKIMSLYANVEKPITHPYNADYKYNSEELDAIVENWFNAIDETEGLQELKSYVEDGDYDSLYEAYRNVVLESDESPFEYATDEKEKLIKKGYDAVEFVEGVENNVIEGAKGNEPVISYAVFNSNQLKNIDNTNPTTNEDIRYSKENAEWNEFLDKNIIENNDDIEKLNMPKSPYQTLRPNVRGGWNIEKIQKQLKNESSNRVNSKDLSKFDNLDDLMNNIYYHGSISAHDNLKAGSTLQESQRTGGYGQEYHSISLSGNKNIASNFASMGQNGTVMPVILKKNANVIEMPNIEDSIELEDILPELWNKGVDAVKIGDWDIETKGYGEQELVILNPRAIMTMPQGTTYFQNYHKPKFQNMTKEEILETLTKTKERALNDPKLKPGQAEEIKSRYDKLIKFSKDNQIWNEYLQKEFKSEGTKTKLGDIKLPTKEVKLPGKTKKSLPTIKEQTNASEIADEINNVTKSRSLVKTLTESDALKGKVLIKDLDASKLNYVVESNQKSVDTANNHLNTYGYEKSLEDVKSLLRSDKLPKASDVALAERVLQEAVRNGDTKTAQDLIMDIAILGTDLGQATQALSIIKRLTPEGQLSMYTKMIQRAKSRGEKSFENVEITTDMVQNVLDAYNEDGTYDQQDLNNRVEQFKQEIANQMKTTTGEKVNAWRYLAMLGNPKTHIRNIVSNVAMNGTIKVKNAMARTLESVLPVENRTKTWKKASNFIKNYAETTANEMKGIITGENKYNEKSSLEAKKRTFKSDTLEKISNFNSNALEAEDWFFSKRAFISNLEEYLTANGINTQEDIESRPEVVEKAKNYAKEQAEIATFRQYSKLAAQINNLEKNNKLARTFIEATVPFKKTPINVAKAGVKYSPLGLIKSLSYDIYQVKQGNMEASQLIDNISQGLTGTSLAILGYALAKNGILNGGGDDDKEGKYDTQLGDNQYSLKIGDKSYSISWLSPVAMPLLVGANAFEQLEEKEEWDMNVVSETLAKTLDPLNEMSFMQGLTNALSSYDKGVEKLAGIGESVAQNYVGQFFPTIFSQFASTIDDKKRSTKASANSTYKFGEQTLRSVMYKLPGLRQQLEVATDVWGNEKEQADNIIQRAYESFLAPYSTTKNITSDLDKELKRVYNETGENGVIPSVPYAYVKYGDETYRMSAKEYTQYKKTYGQTANKLLNNTIQSQNYKILSDEEKAKVLKDVFGYSKYVANKEYFDNTNVNYTSKEYDKVDLYSKVGKVSDYYLSKAKSFEADKDANGKTISGSAKKKVVNYINSLNASIPEKAMLIKLYGNFTFNDYNKQIIEYVNNKNISKSDKETLLTKLGFTIKDGRVYSK